MYSNKFVISILVNGQVQKEFANGEVHLPFGSEYQIRLRNKNDRQAVCRLYIDGEKMCKGGYVIPANSYRDLECPSTTLKKFKFVDLQSTEAQDHGKDQHNIEKDMGVVEAHWYLEKERPKEVHHYHPQPFPVPIPYYPKPWTPPWYPYKHEVTTWGNPNWKCGGGYKEIAKGGTTHDCSSSWGNTGGGDQWPNLLNPLPDKIQCSVPPPSTNIPPVVFPCCDTTASPPPPSSINISSTSSHSLNMNDSTTTDFDALEERWQKPHQDEDYWIPILPQHLKRAVRDGATVEGGYSNQRFGECNVNIEEHATVLRLFLRGFEAEKEVEENVDAEVKYCDKCGSKALKKGSNFCHICGKKFRF